MASLSLLKSEKIRAKIDKAQAQQISKMYSDLSKLVAKRAQMLKGRDNISSILRVQYLNDMEKELNKAIGDISKRLNVVIPDNMKAAVEAVVEDNKFWLDKFNFPSDGAFLHVPQNVVEKVVTGQLYQEDWSLSSELWKDAKNKQSDINKVVAKGIAQNKSAFDIAKDLESYVDPKVRKDWAWSKVYPGTSKKVDYVAQRLARTMVSHAYQQSLVDTTKDNPFVTKIRWRSAMVHGRTCDLCKERHNKLFDKDKLPLDHPNGLCTYTAEIGDLEDVASEIADWSNGKPNAKLDKFADTLRGGKIK